MNLGKYIGVGKLRNTIKKAVEDEESTARRLDNEQNKSVCFNVLKNIISM